MEPSLYERIFRPPPGLTPIPWTYNEILFSSLLMIVAFMIIVTAIYLPWIDSDTCSAPRLRSRSHALPYPTPRESKMSLTQFSRDLSGRESGQHSAVMVMEPMFTGLSVLSIPSRPVYSIAKLAAESKAAPDDKFVPVYKHHFPMITVSGKKSTAEELCMTVRMAQTLVKPNGTLIMNGMDQDSEAFDALGTLVTEGVLKWNPADLYKSADETWISAKFIAVNPEKCVSEHIYDEMYRYLGLSDSANTYFVISKTREDELRRAYKSDTSFRVTNTTTAILGAVLKVLFPDIRLALDRPNPSVALPVDPAAPTPSVDATPMEETIYFRALDFLDDYILA